jgi:hypothetical protein
VASLQWGAIRKRGGGFEKYAKRSMCARYQIARIVINGVDRFELWRLSDKTVLGSYSTSKAAEQAADIFAGVK